MMIFTTLGFITYRLWVGNIILYFDCGIHFANSLHRFFLRNLFSDIERKKMGGKRKSMEPVSCKEWKKKEEVWVILMSGNFMSYMERLKGVNPVST